MSSCYPNTLYSCYPNRPCDCSYVADGSFSEDELFIMFSGHFCMKRAPFKGQNPLFVSPSQPPSPPPSPSSAQPGKQLPRPPPPPTSNSPLVCPLCDAWTVTGSYLGRGRWSVTCRRCVESFIINLEKRIRVARLSGR